MSPPTSTMRREAVLRAVVAVHAHMERCMGGGGPVRPFHVRYFGLDECITDLSIKTIADYMRGLAYDGLLERPTRALEFIPTPQGRQADAG